MKKLNIQFYLNSKFKNISVPANITVLEYIRNYSGLTGTKMGCGEGDCGTCTIAVGKLQDNKLKYKAVNSCLMPVGKMQHKHIVTIEGLQQKTELHLVQKMVVENHATQCGFCTPGINMSLFTYLQNNPKNPNLEDATAALEGNLCRCTGYNSIRKTAKQSIDFVQKNGFKTPDYFSEVEEQIQKLVTTQHKNGTETDYFIPNTIDEYLYYINQNPTAKVVCGGSDLMLEVKFKGKVFEKIVDISEVDAFNFIKEKNSNLIIGANTNLTQISENKFVKQHFPVLLEAIAIMASKQIRNIATLAGNIGNASPVADSVPILLAADASLYLLSATGKKRTLKLKDFYLGYKKIALQPNEIIESIALPLPSDVFLSFEKTSKRKSVDISTVSSAMAIAISENKISDIRIAFGGVAATPVFLTEIQDFMIGKKLSSKLIEQAAEMAQQTVQPISDMRGSLEYRKLLVKNHIIKHFNKFQNKK